MYLLYNPFSFNKSILDLRNKIVIIVTYDILLLLKRRNEIELFVLMS